MTEDEIVWLCISLTPGFKGLVFPVPGEAHLPHLTIMLLLRESWTQLSCSAFIFDPNFDVSLSWPEQVQFTYFSV